MTDAATRAVVTAIDAGADGFTTDEAFFAHTQRLLGDGWKTPRLIAVECRRRIAMSKNFPDAIAFQTLRAAALRRVK